MKFSAAVLLAATALIAVADTAVLATTSCCSLLISKLPGKVFYSTSTAYNASMTSFWSLQATYDDPSCILRPTVNTDVATAVKTVAGANCKFSVKGGGHTPWKGAASINKGVMIDMANINATTVNAAGNVASIGSGARWGDFYTALIALGKVVAVGRDSAVGVGGLVVGGGYSWFTSKMGFVTDGFVNFELVTGAGQIINVNVTSNFDLCWPQGRCIRQLHKLRLYRPACQFDKLWQYHQSTNESVIFNVMDYTLPIENPPIYDQVNAIPSLIEDTTRIADLKIYTDELSSAAQYNRQIFLTMTFVNNATMYQAAVDISNAHLAPIADTPGLIWSLLFQLIPRLVINNSIANGGNSLGLDRFDDNLILYLLYVTWDDPAYDTFLADVAYATLDEIEAKSCDLETENPWIYLNYAGQYQDVLPGYGPDCIATLKALSLQYGPAQVFQTLVPGGYKVSLQ